MNEIHLYHINMLSTDSQQEPDLCPSYRPFLKPPFNYIGQKYPILHELLPHFPEKKNVNTFWDVFCGGGSVFSNVEYENIAINDILTPVIEFYMTFQNMKFEDFKAQIEPCLIPENNMEQYDALRKKFNSDFAPDKFFCLMAACHKNVLKFSKTKKFNQVYGNRTMSPDTWDSLQSFHSRIKEKNIQFHNKNYVDLIDLIGPSDFVYLDPPHISEKSGYEVFWSEELEYILMDFIKCLDDKNIKFALSSCSTFKGTPNKFLPDMNTMLKKFEVVEIKNGNKSKTQEILIKNF